MYSTHSRKSLAVAIDFVFTRRFGCWDLGQATRAWKTAIQDHTGSHLPSWEQSAYGYSPCRRRRFVLLQTMGNEISCSDSCLWRSKWVAQQWPFMKIGLKYLKNKTPDNLEPDLLCKLKLYSAGVSYHKEDLSDLLVEFYCQWAAQPLTEMQRYLLVRPTGCLFPLVVEFIEVLARRRHDNITKRGRYRKQWTFFCWTFTSW